MDMYVPINCRKETKEKDTSYSIYASNIKADDAAALKARYALTTATKEEYAKYLADKDKQEKQGEPDVSEILEQPEKPVVTEPKELPQSNVYDKGVSVGDNPPHKRSESSSVELDAAAFDDFVISRGIPTLWQQAFICPCIDPETHQANPLCPICHGTWRGYLPAVKDTYVAIQGQDRGTVRSDELGNLDLGTASGTFRASTNVNILDRIIIPSLSVRQNYVFTVTENRYKSGFYIPYDISEIIYIVGGKSNSMTDLIENTDYVYKKDEQKIYILNKGLIGSNVSMILKVALRYIVTNVIKDTRYQYNHDKKKTEKMPVLATLKRESILTNNIPLVPKSTEDMQEEANQALSKEGLQLVKSVEESGLGLDEL